MQASYGGQICTVTIENQDVKAWQDYQAAAFLIAMAWAELEQNAAQLDSGIVENRRHALAKLRRMNQAEAYAAMSGVEWS